MTSPADRQFANKYFLINTSYKKWLLNVNTVLFKEILENDLPTSSAWKIAYYKYNSNDLWD